MEESGASLVLSVFVSLKQIIQKMFDFVCDKTFYRKIMIKSALLGLRQYLATKRPL